MRFKYKCADTIHQNLQDMYGQVKRNIVFPLRNCDFFQGADMKGNMTSFVASGLAVTILIAERLKEQNITQFCAHLPFCCSSSFM